MCLFFCPSPHSSDYCTDPGVTWRNCRRCPLVVHYWAYLQSVHRFRCYDNTHVCKLIALYAANAYSAKREMSASACTRSMTGSFIVFGGTRLLCALEAGSVEWLSCVADCCSVILVNIVASVVCSLHLTTSWRYTVVLLFVSACNKAHCCFCRCIRSSNETEVKNKIDYIRLRSCKFLIHSPGYLGNVTRSLSCNIAMKRMQQ